MRLDAVNEKENEKKMFRIISLSKNDDYINNWNTDFPVMSRDIVWPYKCRNL